MDTGFPPAAYLRSVQTYNVQFFCVLPAAKFLYGGFILEYICISLVSIFEMISVKFTVFQIQIETLEEDTISNM